MKFFKNMMPVLLGFLLIAGSVAQGQQKQQPTESDSVTDSELKKFADVSVESQKVQREMTEQVDSMLSEEDMDMQRFRQIMLSKRNPQMADSIEVSDKEEETMKKKIGRASCREREERRGGAASGRETQKRQEQRGGRTAGQDSTTETHR